MLVAFQMENPVQLVNINKDTGMLSREDMVWIGNQPTLVCFVD